MAAADRAFQLQFATDGSDQRLHRPRRHPTGYTTGAYTPVGTYTIGWTQYRIVYTFTGSGAQTYTLSKRASATDAWTQLKAAGATGYAIPLRGTNTITATHGTLLRGLGSGASCGSTTWPTRRRHLDAPRRHHAPTAPAALSAVDTPSDAGGSIDLSWAASTDDVGVTGYKLYRGTAPGVYGAPIALGNVTTYTDATAVTGTRYYYAVSAVDAAGNEGAKSPEANADRGRQHCHRQAAGPSRLSRQE